MIPNTCREALTLYRDIIRASRFFSLSDSCGVSWRDVLWKNAKREFDQDLEIVTRLLIGGRDAVQATTRMAPPIQRQHQPHHRYGWGQLGVDFRFVAIPKGLPPSDCDATQDITELCVFTAEHSVTPFRDLLLRIDGPPVSCVIVDGVMSFAQRVAEELGVVGLVFWITSACGLIGYLQFDELTKGGYTPLNDESYLTNVYLENT